MADTDSDGRPGDCRLCGGGVVGRFSLRVLGKLDVTYSECSVCKSLQTAYPTWIEESYRQNLSGTDTGALQRNLQNFAYALIVSSIFDAKTAFDYGGGDGLLCRFLRDHSIDCYVYDKYSSPGYAQGFTTPPFERPDLLTAFEVFEHFVDPKAALAELLAKAPQVMVVTTSLYTGQAADWWYLDPETGQHVFFYSPQALMLIAQSYRYHVAQAGNCFLFVNQAVTDAEKKIFAAQKMLDGWIFQAIKSYMFSLPTPGSEKDFHDLQSRIER